MENNKIRKIQVYSNCSDERLDYRKDYWFHHWLDKKLALIEDEKGELLEVKYENFRFDDKN